MNNILRLKEKGNSDLYVTLPLQGDLVLMYIIYLPTYSVSKT